MPEPQSQGGNDESAWGKARARTAGALMSSPSSPPEPTGRSPGPHENSAGGTSSSCRWSALLTGIVTRSDLLDDFIRSDVEIRGEVEQDVLGRILGLDEGTVAVEVRDGVVTLRGHVPQPRLVPVVVGLCQGVDVSSP